MGSINKLIVALVSVSLALTLAVIPNSVAKKPTADFEVTFGGLVVTQAVSSTGDPAGTKFVKGAVTPVDLTGSLDGLAHPNFACGGVAELDDVDWTRGTFTIRRSGDVFVRFSQKISCGGEEDRYHMVIDFKDANPEIDGNQKTYSTTSANIDFVHYSCVGKGKNSMCDGHNLFHEATGPITVTVIKV